MKAPSLVLPLHGRAYNQIDFILASPIVAMRNTNLTIFIPCQTGSQWKRAIIDWVYWKIEPYCHLVDKELILLIWKKNKKIKKYLGPILLSKTWQTLLLSSGACFTSLQSQLVFPIPKCQRLLLLSRIWWNNCLNDSSNLLKSHTKFCAKHKRLITRNLIWESLGGWGWGVSVPSLSPPPLVFFPCWVVIIICFPLLSLKCTIPIFWNWNQISSPFTISKRSDRYVQRKTHSHRSSWNFTGTQTLSSLITLLFRNILL